MLEAGRATVVYHGTVQHGCVGPNRDVFRSLVLSLLGAFKTGALRREVDLPNLAWILQYSSPCDRDTSPCQRCRDCFQYLPLYESIYASVFKAPRYYCLNADIIWRLLSEQPGIEMGIKCISERILCTIVQRETRIGTLVEESEGTVKYLSQKWRFGSRMPISVWFFPESTYERLDGLMKRGLDPAQVRLKGFIEKLGHLFGHRMCITRMRKTSFGVWSKSAVEGLAARGFPVDCDSIPVIADRFISKECDPDLFDPSNFISY